MVIFIICHNALVQIMTTEQWTDHTLPAIFKNIENIFSGAYIGNFSKVLLTLLYNYSRTSIIHISIIQTLDIQMLFLILKFQETISIFCTIK